MKKNTMMRIASFLLIAVLLSTSAISGTYAKYVTTDSASDTARVAKFGVVATVDGTLFAKTYKNAANNNIIGEATDTNEGVLTVVSSNDDKLVAPGTQNTTGMNFVLTGTPEVDVYVEFKFEVVDGKEVKLPASTYTDPTNPKADPFVLATDYYPVVFTLKKDGNELISGNVAAINSWLNDPTNGLTRTYEAKTPLENIGGITGAGNYTLTWAWAYGAFEGISDNDRADTILGNMAVADPTAQNVNMEVKFTITVTQVD